MPTDQFRHWGPPFGAGFGPDVNGPFHLIPFLGGLMFLLFILTLLIVGFVLTKRGHLQPPFVGRAFAGPGAPETGARTILAERFARGDITSDEFMERAAVLNWTPGIDPWSADRPRSSQRSR